jgi:hypothetical protein
MCWSVKLWFNHDKLRIVPDGFACCNVSQGFAVLKDYIDTYKGPNKAKGSIVRWTPHNFFLHLTSGQIWTRWKELRINLACMGIATFVKILGLKILAWNFEIFVVWDFNSTYAWCNIWGWRPCMGIVRATKKSWVSKSKVLAHCANKMIFCSS